MAVSSAKVVARWELMREWLNHQTDSWDPAVTLEQYKTVKTIEAELLDFQLLHSMMSMRFPGRLRQRRHRSLLMMILPPNSSYLLVKNFLCDLEDLVLTRLMNFPSSSRSASRLEGLVEKGLVSPSERYRTRVRVQLAFDPEIRGFLMPQLNCRTHGPWPCDQCQRPALVSKLPPENLKSISSQWPFRKWDMGIVGKFPMAPGQKVFLLVNTYYFSIWVKAEAPSRITDLKIRKLMWTNVITRFGVPQEIVTDNEPHFTSHNFKSKDWDIKLAFTTPRYPSL
ncbi:hypothetical protein Bca4012_072722 [Brassica carinata]